MESTQRIYPNVSLPEDATLGDFVIVGIPPRGAAPGEHPVEIGPGPVIRSHTTIYAGNTIGAGFQTGHGVRIRELNQIGDQVSIGTNSIVEHHVQIGDGVRIHSGVFVPEYSILEDGAWLGPRVVFTNSRYPCSPGERDHLKGPHLKKGAIIGANATLLPAVVIGERSVVGAGAVVVHDVPDGVVVAGNPARVIKRVDEIDAYGTQ